MQGDYLVQLLHKVHLEGAAYATVLQGYQAVIVHTYHTSLLDEAGVYVHLTYIIYYYRKLNAFAVAQDTVEQRCLTAAQVTGEQQDRSFIVHNSKRCNLIPCKDRNHRLFYQKVCQTLRTG